MGRDKRSRDGWLPHYRHFIAGKRNSQSNSHKISSLSLSRFNRYSKMSLREVAALIDSRQETNSKREYNTSFKYFLYYDNTVEGFACSVSVRLLYIV